VEWAAATPVRSFAIVFGLALFIRTAVLLSPMIPDEYVQPHTDWEVQAVAASLAETGRFADPYAVPTGPTAHVNPIPTAVIGLVYEVFGFGMTAGYVRCFVAIVLFSALWGLLPWAGNRLGVGAPAGLLAGLAGALLMRQGSSEVIGGGDEPYATIALVILLVAFVRRWSADVASPRSSFLLGLAWGVAFHMHPAILTVLIGCLAFEAWWRRGAERWRGPVVLVLGATVALAPWTWRNHTQLGGLMFVRSNLGLELRVGNHAGATPDVDLTDRRIGLLHPRTDVEEAMLVRDVGERAYMRQAGREAVDWIQAHPASYLKLAALRVLHFWLGPLHRPGTALLLSLLTLLAVVGAWRAWPLATVPQRAALLIPLATFPITYYVVSYMLRYRAPLEWLFLLLAGGAVWHWIAAEADRARA
jgi:hypothetical protein